jgi:FkbM family methyltransferase
LNRPELLAAFDDDAARHLRDERAMSAVLAATLRSDSCFVDVGTNRGQILREAVRLAPHGAHVAFEPITGLAIELAARFPTVDCRNVAVAAAGTATFCHFRRLDGWSGLHRQTTIDDAQGDPEFIEVTVVTLDDELRNTHATVIKIDVEGAERDVLLGARHVIEDTQPVVIFEHDPAAAALFGAGSAEIWDYFADLGYRVFSITGEGPIDREAFAAPGRAINWLATPATLRRADRAARSGSGS